MGGRFDPERFDQKVAQLAVAKIKPKARSVRRMAYPTSRQISISFASESRRSTLKSLESLRKTPS